MFKEKRYIVALFGGLMVLAALITSSCSSPPPPKTAIQLMLEDYDYMAETVRAVLPSIGVSKLVYGLDIEQKFADYRKQITPETDKVEFIRIVDDALRACKGINTRVNSVLEGFNDNALMSQVVGAHIPREAIDNTNDYINALRNLRDLPDPSIELLYHDGAYYSKYDFTVNGTAYPRGMKLTEIDGIATMTQVKNLEDKLDAYDYKNKIFYGCMSRKRTADNFYVLLPKQENGLRKFTFEKGDGSVCKIALAQTDTVKVLNPAGSIQNLEKTVKYLPSCKMIYIRLPEMDSEFTEFYDTEINKILDTESDIVAMVLDVRGNRGGSDIAWQTVLSPFMPRVNVSFTLAIKNSPVANAYIDHRMAMLKRFNIITHLERTSNAVIPYIDPVSMFLFRAYTSFSTDNKGVMPVYILTRNAYGATGNLLSLAHQVPDFTRVGNRNPVPLGVYADPLYFSMPNIKVAFSVNSQVEITSAFGAEEMQFTQVNEEVELTATEMIDFLNKNVGDLEKFLLNDDPYFKKVIDLRKPKAPEPEKKPEAEGEKKPEAAK